MIERQERSKAETDGKREQYIKRERREADVMKKINKNA